MEVGEGDRFLRLLIEHSDDPAVLEETVRAARSKSELVAALQNGDETSRRAEFLTRTLMQALRILYVDGVVAELRERAA